MNQKQHSRRDFVKQISMSLTALSFPLSTLAQYDNRNNTFHNYEEALKKPLEVKKLVFSFNNSYHPYTKALPDARIQTFVNLEELFIDGYEGKYMNLPNEISKLKKLSRLTIYCGNLFQIPKQVWGLQSLTTLYLEINALKEKDLKLSSLPQLEDFGIKVHKTEMLPEGIFENSKLKKLFIQSYEAKVIPDQFNKLPDLTLLTLHCENLTVIPGSIGSLKKLKVFDIYNKTLKSLNINFSDLDSLHDFRWGQSLIFPSPLAAAKNLKALRLDVSFFDAINTDTPPLKKLEILDLSFSKLKAIPQYFATLHSVKSMYLAYNNFTSIEFDFSQLTNLTELSFGDCENFGVIDMNKFIKSLKTIRKLESLKTPRLSDEQRVIKEAYNYDFDWWEQQY